MTKPRILIVDDEIIIARDLETRLTRLGYVIPAVASSGTEAIALARELMPDLVLMDIVLKGGMDGIEAAAEIRRANQIPVVYLTAYTDLKTLERAKVTEPFGFIVKPFSERELYANIEMALYKHRVESRLRKMEQWVVGFVNDVADAVIAADLEGRITFINPAAEVITGWSRDEAVGRKLEEVLRLVQRTSGEPIAFDGVEEGPVVCAGGETLLLDREERSIPVGCTRSCVRDPGGRPNGTVTVLREMSGEHSGALVALSTDVTFALALAVTAPQMLQLCAEAIVRHLHAAFARIWTLNATGDTLLLQASAGMYTHLDGPHGKVPVGMYKIGKIAQERKAHLTNDVLHDERVGDPEWARREGMVAFAGYPLLIEGRIVGVAAMFSRYALSDSVLDSLESISSAMALGIERKHLEEQLRQSQKMEAIGQLAAGVAHDFNNLLTVISGYSQLILSRPDLGSDTRAQVVEIGKAGESAASLTRQLLAFGRKQALELRPIDLNVLVAGLDTMLRRLIGANISLGTSFQPALGKVVSDTGQLEQVLVNLVVNARDATPDGGSVLIETENVELDAAYCRGHHGATPGSYAMVAVTDTGVGMSPEVISRVFEPFYTTKAVGEGTGLGLSTVHGIVHQMGGYIGVYSEPGIGSSFKVYLPRAKAGAVLQDLPGREEETMPPGTETILLVEDEEGVRALGRLVLESCGYTVLEAPNGNAALALATASVESIDLVVTDVVMPGLGGRHLAEQLQKTRPDLRILFISGYTDDAVIRHGVLSAETPFLQKPFTPVALARKVRELLDLPRGAGAPIG